MALGVNVRGGFEGGLEGLKIRGTGGVEGPSAGWEPLASSGVGCDKDGV